MSTLLIGYDVENPNADNTTRRFLEQALPIHAKWEAPMTLFLLGRTLENNIDAIKTASEDPLVFIGQHTYSHQLFKTLCIEVGESVTLVAAGTPELIDEEIAKTNALIEEHLEITCIGMTAPYNYYRGLRDRPDILRILRKHGIRYIRADGRDSHDYQPAPMIQPYWYERSGYPEILEMATHGWHDNLVRGDVLGWDDLDGYVQLVQSYIDMAIAEDAIYSICAHDWSSVRGDPDLTHVDRILQYARERGMTIGSYSHVYQTYEAKRLSSQPGTTVQGPAQ